MELARLLDQLEGHLRWLQQQNYRFLPMEPLQLEFAWEEANPMPEEREQAASFVMEGRAASFQEEPAFSASAPLASGGATGAGTSAHFQAIKARLSASTASVTSTNHPKKSASTLQPSLEGMRSTPVSLSSSHRPPSELNTLDELYKEYRTCMRCPLGPTRQNFVFGSGHAQARLLFVGEGPGADEDRQGLPFVGKAGQLLTKMIQSIGIDRADVYIANVVKCRPPENRVPHPEEARACAPILQRQMELLNPQLIVTLGNVSTQALLPEAPGITKSRGQFYEYQQWPLMPTFHPAYLLRNPNAMDQAWADFQKIAQFCWGGI